MKKVMFFAVAAMSAAFAMAADDLSTVMYWQVLADKVDSAVGQYDTASFYVLDGDNVTRTQIGEFVWDTTQTAGASAIDSTPQITYSSVDLANYTGASFLAELYFYNGSGFDTVGTSTPISYSELAKYMIRDIPGSSAIPPAGVFAPSFAAAVPEPTSGLLMLLGVAGLALRRRRA